MTKSKKLLSIFLAVVMVLSSFTVGFYAIAADEGETADTAVTDAQSKIEAFEDYKSDLYDDESEDHNAAVKTFDEAVATVKALSEDQRVALSKSHYGFILYYVTIGVAREQYPDESRYSNKHYISATMEHLDKIEAKIGDIPEKYMEVYDAYKAFYYEYGITSSTNWKEDSAACAALDTWQKAVVAFDADQLAFAKYLSPSSNVATYGKGFYFYSFTTTSAGTDPVNNLITYEYNRVQDFETEAGKDPSSVSRSKYIDHKRVDGVYVDSWVEGQNGATYLQAWQDYYDLYVTDVVEVSQKALANILALYEDTNKGLTEAVNNYIEVGKTVVMDKENADLEDVKATLEEFNNLSDSIKSVANSFLGSSKLKVAAELVTAIEFNEDTTAKDAYDNQPKVTSYYGSQLTEPMNAFVNEAILAEFNKAVEAADLDALTDEVIAEAKSLYSQLSGDNKKAISEEIFDKFVQMVAPVKDTTDFSDEIAAFQPTDFVRPTNSNVAWTEGGIQNFVDMLEDLLAGFVDIGDILSSNLYKASIVNMIFDLYATLSHNETMIEGLISLGDIISGVITPEYITTSLPEAKFKGVVDKINAAKVEDTDPEGTNILDKIAAIEFTAEDWGFTDGDQEGFINALLAVIRPITQLLDPDAEISFKALGILTVTAQIGINMFDSKILDNGDYGVGIYENLLPLLEQLGLNDLPTTEEYRANYYAVKEADGAAVAADEFLRPIIESLFTNVVEPLAADPVNTLVDVLPRLAYVVDGDRLNSYIQKAFKDQGKIVTVSLVGDDPLLDLSTLGLDLSTAAINELIPDSIDIGALIGDGTEFVLEIGDLPWTTLANCATLSVVPSSSIYNENVLLRTGDVDSCFSTVFYWLYDVALAEDDTYASLKDLIIGLVPENSAAIINTVIKNVLDPIHDAGKIDGYGLLLDNIFIGAMPTGNEIWRVDAAAGEGGTINPNGAVAVKQGESKTFTITANEGYKIASVTVDGKAVAAAADQKSYELVVNGAELTTGDAVNQYATDSTVKVTFATDAGEPAPGPDDPSDPDDPNTPSGGDDQQGGNQGGNQGGSNTGSDNDQVTFPGASGSASNPNLPNTGAAEVAGMGVVTVILALAAGVIVYLVLRKRIAE